MKDRQSIKKAIREFTGQVRAAWAQGTSIAIDAFDHFHSVEAERDTSLIGMLYNGLVDDHKPLANAVKAAAWDCCGVKFRKKKEEEEGPDYIAYCDKDAWPKGTEFGIKTSAMLEAMALLSSQDANGLKEWKPKPRTGSQGGSRNSQVHGAAKLIEDALTKLEAKPEGKEVADQYRKRLMEMVTDLSEVLPKYDLGGLVSNFYKASARALEQESKGEGEKEKSKAA